MHSHEHYNREHYTALAVRADEITDGAYGFAEQIGGAFTRRWPDGADNVEVITDDILCCLPDGYELFQGDDAERLHWIAADYRTGERVALRTGTAGTVAEDIAGHDAHEAHNYHVLVNWDADEDGGPYEDEVFNPLIRRIS